MKILRLRQVIEQTGLGKSTIYNKISEGSFPKQVRLSARAVGWCAEEVDEFLAKQVAQSRNREVQDGLPDRAFRKLENAARAQREGEHQVQNWRGIGQASSQSEEGVQP